MSRNEIKRGEIYYITFAPVVGSEQHGGRPGIVVSNNMNNAHSKPSTTKTEGGYIP